MSRWKNIEGSGSVCFEADGSVRLFVSDEVADLVVEAERRGMSADQLVNKIVDDAEAEIDRVVLADGTGVVVRMVPEIWSPEYS